jgi:hypothetical protein
MGFSGEQSAVIATQLLMSVIALVTGHPGPSPFRWPLAPTTTPITT